ncbi:MAG TPA: hypothetical protein VF811_10145 [Parasulfuritortus sp.]
MQQLDDDTFMIRFERLDLGPEYFDHRGHLRMGWLHLRRYGLDEGNARVCDGIRSLAMKFGAPGKFNHTLTEALMRIMAVRMDDAADPDFDAFLVRNPDLVDDSRGVLARHYSDALLNSAEAHAGWVGPDRAAIR